MKGLHKRLHDIGGLVVFVCCVGEEVCYFVSRGTWCFCFRREWLMYQVWMTDVFVFVSQALGTSVIRSTRSIQLTNQ